MPSTPRVRTIDSPTCATSRLRHPSARPQFRIDVCLVGAVPSPRALCHAAGMTLRDEPTPPGLRRAKGPNLRRKLRRALRASPPSACAPAARCGLVPRRAKIDPFRDDLAVRASPVARSCNRRFHSVRKKTGARRRPFVGSNSRPDEVGPTGRRFHTRECETFGLANSVYRGAGGTRQAAATDSLPELSRTTSSASPLSRMCHGTTPAIGWVVGFPPGACVIFTRVPCANGPAT